MNGQRLEIEHEMKYLGIYLDDKLKLDKNTNNLCKELGQKMSVLGRLRRELNKGQKAFLYKSIIEPHFTYCASVLSLSSRTDEDRLQKLQNKCSRNILDVNKYSSSTQMLEVMNRLSVNQMIIFRTLIFIRKIINGHVPKYLTEKIKFNRDTHSRLLRNSNEIELVRAIKECNPNSLFFGGIQLYNSLANEIKIGNVDVAFERRLKNYIKEKFN